MKNATVRTARKAAAFDYAAYQARLKGAIVAADNASAAIVATVIELRGHADEDKAREIFKQTYMTALGELRGVDPETLASDPVVQARTSDCLAIFRAPELPEGMSTRSVQGAAKACRDAAKAAAGEAPADKGKRAPRQPTGDKGDNLTPIEAVRLGLELLRQQAGKASKAKAKKALELVADVADLIDEIAATLGE